MNNPNGTKYRENQHLGFINEKLKYFEIVVTTDIKSTDTKRKLEFYSYYTEFLTRFKATAEVALSSGDFTGGFDWAWLDADSQFRDTVMFGMIIVIVSSTFIIFSYTGNTIVGILVMISTGFVVCSITGVITLKNWQLGQYEVFWMIFSVGYASNNLLHLSNAYCSSTHSRAKDKTMDAYSKMKPIILSSFLTQVGTSCSMFGCKFQTF